MKFLQNENGSITLIVLSILAMLTIMTLSSVTVSTDDMEVSFNQINEDIALYIAEAGYNRAVAELTNDSSWNAGFDNNEFNDGTFSVRIVDSTSDSTLFDTVLIYSTGKKSGAEVNLLVTVVPGVQYPFQFAAFGDIMVTIQQNSCTDSYNSNSTYAASRNDSLGNVGSNGTVAITTTSTVGGDVSVATGGTLTLQANSVILGDSTTTADPVTLNAVADSEFVQAEINSNIAGISGNYTYDPVAKTLYYDSLLLQEGTYFFSKLHSYPMGDLYIAPGAKVEIYITGEFEVEHSSTANANGEPAALAIFSNGAEGEIEHNSIFNGIYYGPNSEFEIEHNSEVFGSIVAREIEIEDYSCFHFDEQLRNYGKGKGDGIEVIAWKELDD